MVEALDAARKGEAAELGMRRYLKQVMEVKETVIGFYKRFAVATMPCDNEDLMTEDPRHSMTTSFCGYEAMAEELGSSMIHHL